MLEEAANPKCLAVNCMLMPSVTCSWCLSATNMCMYRLVKMCSNTSYAFFLGCPTDLLGCNRCVVAKQARNSLQVDAQISRQTVDSSHGVGWSCSSLHKSYRQFCSPCYSP